MHTKYNYNSLALTHSLSSRIYVTGNRCPNILQTCSVITESLGWLLKFHFFNVTLVYFSVNSQVDPLTYDDGTKSGEPDQVEFPPPQRKKERRKPSLVKAAGKVFWKNFFISALFKVVYDTVEFVQPQLLE